MKRLIFAFLLFVMGGPVSGAEVAINGGDKVVPKYSFAELSVLSNKGDRVGWQVFPRPVKTADDSTGKFFISWKPGAKYTVFVTIVNFGPDGTPETKDFKKRFDQGSVEVSMEGEGEVSPVDPVDPIEASLTSELRKAFKLETASDKALKDELASVYDKGVSVASTAKTWGELFEAMAKEATELKVSGKLPACQAVLQKYLKDNLPWKGAVDTPLDAAGRKKAKAVFRVVSAALENLK